MKPKIHIILLAVLAVAVFLLGNRAALMWQESTGNFVEQLEYIFSGAFFSSFSLTFNRGSVLFGVLCLFLLAAFWFYNFGNRRNTRAGEEHGSAKFGEPSDVKPYTSKETDGNIILSKNVRLSLSNAVKDPLYHTNKNVIVIGGSGAGKTRFYVKPNLLQRHSCYVVTDPKGTCLAEVGNALHIAGYKIKCFNTVDLTKSMKYNPLAYAQTEQDILKLVDALMLNTQSPDSRSGDQFWQDAEKLLFAALIAYVVFDAPPELPKNFNSFLDLFEKVTIPTNSSEQLNTIDRFFITLKEKAKRETFSIRCYKGFKKAPPKTAAGILISASARLMPFYISSLRNIFETDEMELDKIGFETTAHFLIVDDTDGTFNFVVGMLYSQMLTRMIRNADAMDGKLPVHTRLIMDEAANIAQIRNLDKVTAQIRSREISINLIYQSSKQLTALYDKHAEVIEGNFDTTVFLGSGDFGLAKLMSERMGTETVNYTTKSESRGINGSVTRGEGITGRPLMTSEEVRAMPGDECIVFLKGLDPIRDKKYPLEKHPLYKLTGDANKALRYDQNKPQPHLAKTSRAGTTTHLTIEGG